MGAFSELDVDRQDSEGVWTAFACPLAPADEVGVWAGWAPVVYILWNGG